MVTGCLLCGAPAASAQPLAAVAPFSTAHGGGLHPAGPVAVRHNGGAAPTPRHDRTPPGVADHAPKGGGPPVSAQHPHGGHSLEGQATGHHNPQVTTTTTSGGTAATRQARFARAPATSTQASTSLSSKPSQPSDGNGTTRTDNAKRIRTTDTNGGNGRATANGNPRSKASGKGKGNGSIAAPAPGTPAAETVAAPVPAQRPVRPERFFSLPLAPLSPIPAVGGPLPGSALPLAPARKAGSELFRFGASVLPRTWAGDSLKESGKLKLPIALMAATALFMLVQALIDRRDPKVSDAPERPTDDSVGFG